MPEPCIPGAARRRRRNRLIRRRLGHDARIRFYHYFRSVVLSIYRQLQEIGAGLEDRAEVLEAAATTTSATKSWRKVGRTSQRIAAQVPLNTINANVFRADD